MIRTYVTKLMAINPETGHLCEYAGPMIKGNGAKDAHYYCQENGLGYLEVLGESDSTINTETGQLYVDGHKVLGSYLRWIQNAAALILFLIVPSFSFSQSTSIENFVQIEDDRIVKVGLYDSTFLVDIPGSELMSFHQCQIHYDYLSHKVQLIDSSFVEVFSRQPDIYDGDTGYFEIFTGFGEKRIVEIRALGIDTPERRFLKSREAAMVARSYFIRFLESFPSLLMYTIPNSRFPESQKDDKYGRFLVVFYGVTSQGMLISINDKMVEVGAAIYEDFK